MTPREVFSNLAKGHIVTGSLEKCSLGERFRLPLPGHSSIGSINMRTELHPGVPPPTTESNKGGSMPVIWQKPGTGAYLKYTQNIMLQHQGEDPTGKPDTPYLQH
ncbi:hypothetical protein TNCV_2900571 [Trichonephila clavipes]|nr:hypothetical protein TNCV_2900571 [Trichonephila clavipes]